jgi:DNA-directed RNA polymerase specialized sigma24 family protein
VNHASLLTGHGFTREDVRQQAWVSAILLEAEGSLDPTKFLRLRLVEWMRKATGYSRMDKTGVRLVSFDYPEDQSNPKQGCNTKAWEPSAIGVDYEKILTIGKVREIAQRHSRRSRLIIDHKLKGCSVKDIAASLKISEGRVTQIVKEVIAIAKHSLTAVVLALAIAPMAWGQTPTPEKISSCERITWNANVEPDLSGYQIILEKDGAILPFIEVPKTETAISCADLSIVRGSMYKVKMTAHDYSGNASDPSGEIAFVWPDMQAPLPPQKLCIDVTISGLARQLCLTVE